MGRAGRKRKAGKRYPSGDLVPGRAPDDRIRASRQPHRRQLPEDERSSPVAHCEFGRMYLKGELGHDEIAATRFHAGELYAAIVERYRSVIGSPRGIVGNGAGFDLAAETTPIEDGETVTRFECTTESAEPLERQVRIGNAAMTMRIWPCGESADGCACARRKARYDGAFEALTRVGQRAAKAVSRAAVHNEPLAREDRINLVAGLDALAAHFGLTGRRSRG